MPKIAKDYSKTIIYRIACKDLTIPFVYIGSTTDMARRRQIHRSYCTNPDSQYHHLKLYRVINENGGWDEWDMVMVEEYPCNNSEEARRRERYWFELLSNRDISLNIQLPFISEEERKQKEKMYAKSYYEAHKEASLERQKAYYENNREAAREKYQLNKDKIKQQREAKKKNEIK
jgi:hypothetical protein